MIRNWTWMLVVMVGFAGWSTAQASPVEQCYIPNPGWCPGLAGPTIQDEHDEWHGLGFGATMGLEFVEFHREFLAQSDDFRLYDICVPAGAPEDAVISVVAQPASLLKFAHTSLNLFARPAGCDITLGCGGAPTAWVTRPAVLRLRNPIFHGNTDNGVGMDLDSLFHGNGHVSIGSHDGGGDMLSTFNATRDGAFFQWHKNIDNIYADWAVGQYQLVGNTGTPIYFSVAPSAVGVVATGSSLYRRRNDGDVYWQIPSPPGGPYGGQYGAIPRIGSDIYVGDDNSTNRNLLYHHGIRQWNTLNAWDVDAWTILNPLGTEWYFSVTMGSVGAPGTSVAVQAVKGGDVFQSIPAGFNVLYRTETQIGLAAAASDNLDALEVDQQKRVQATNDYARPGIANRPRQWYSLRSGSTFGVEAAGGALVSPNDILRFNEAGALVIDVTAATLGLAAAGNELDALVLVDMDASETLSPGDRIYYSLAAGSPALGAGSAADILCRVFPGGGACPGGLVARTAASLGLLATDDLDALDVFFFPTTSGACCHAGGGCTDFVSQAACPAPDTFWGPGTVCSAAECPSAPGACCLPDGSCVMRSDIACLSEPGIFQGAGVSCVGLICPPSPPNDECYNAYQIPYDYPNYYEPGNDYYELPPEYTDNTYAYTTDVYSYTDDLRNYSAAPNLPIPDNNPIGISHTINVPDSGVIEDVDIDVVIPDHTAIADLQIEVEHGGTTVALWLNACGSDDGLNVNFDDKGADVVCASPTTGAINPVSSLGTELSAFYGMDKFGPWTITVRDVVGGGSDSDCCFPHGTPGCDDADCQACICDGVGSFCCFVPWDRACAVFSCTFCDDVCDCCGGGTDVGTLTMWSVHTLNVPAGGENRQYFAMPNLPIPDNNSAGVSDVIIVPDSGIIQDVDVDLIIPHTWVGDLCVTLTHGGTTVNLIQEPGNALPGCGVTGFGCGSNNLNVILDDEGVAPMDTLPCPGDLQSYPQSPPNYIGIQALSAFDGMDKNGPWVLNVSDSADADLGTLVQWSLHITNGADYAEYYDPPYSCHDHEVFFPEYGSGTIWYYYDVPPGGPPSNCCFAHPGPQCDDQDCNAQVCGADPFCCQGEWNGRCARHAAQMCAVCGTSAPTQSIGLYTYATYDDYVPGGDYAGDTRIALYYAPEYPADPYGCYGLEEVACGDNHYEDYPPSDQGYGAYGYLEYYDPPPGRYYIQLSTVGDAYRGQIRLRVAEPPPPCPTCFGDVNGDNIVNANDLAALLGDWGPSPFNNPCLDANGDGVINASDLANLLGNWGPC